ncbi:MAG: diguanylate cyclase [Phenylobacterium zucineum]|nr:MAG: diguanylate cyclase [Phenylobacterium zucineum]
MTLEHFVLQANLRHLQARTETIEPADRVRLDAMISAASRELALFEAAASGAEAPWQRALAEDLTQSRAMALNTFRQDYWEAPLPAALIDPRPGLALAIANPAFAEAADLALADVTGRPFFLLFPDNPGDPSATGVASLYTSLRKVVETGSEDAMGVQRYDIRDEAGDWRERYWRPVNRPVTDERDRLVFVLHVSQECDRPAGEVAAPR